MEKRVIVKNIMKRTFRTADPTVAVKYALQTKAFEHYDGFEIRAYKSFDVSTVKFYKWTSENINHDIVTPLKFCVVTFSTEPNIRAYCDELAAAIATQNTIYPDGEIWVQIESDRCDQEKYVKYL